MSFDTGLAKGLEHRDNDDLLDLIALLNSATCFRVTEDISIIYRGNEMWSVSLQGHWALTEDGDTEYEPMPSNRSDEFLARTRSDFQTAWNRAQAYLNEQLKKKRCI